MAETLLFSWNTQSKHLLNTLSGVFGIYSSVYSFQAIIMNTYDLGGFAIWSLDLDDYEAKCEEVPFIVLRTLMHIILEQRAAMKHLAVASGRTKLIGVSLANSVLEYDKGSTLPITTENNDLNLMESELKEVITEHNNPENIELKSMKDRLIYSQDIMHNKIGYGTTEPAMKKMDPSPIQEPPKDSSTPKTIFESKSTVLNIDSNSAKVYINLDEDHDVDMDKNEKNASSDSMKEDIRIHKRVGKYAEVLWNALSSVMDSVTVIVADEMRSFIPDDIMVVLTNSGKNTEDSLNRKRRSSELGKLLHFSIHFSVLMFQTLKPKSFK